MDVAEIVTCILEYLKPEDSAECSDLLNVLRVNKACYQQAARLLYGQRQFNEDELEFVKGIKNNNRRKICSNSISQVRFVRFVPDVPTDCNTSFESLQWLSLSERALIQGMSKVKQFMPSNLSRMHIFLPEHGVSLPPPYPEFYVWLRERCGNLVSLMCPLPRDAGTKHELAMTINGLKLKKLSLFRTYGSYYSVEILDAVARQESLSELRMQIAQSDNDAIEKLLERPLGAKFSSSFDSLYLSCQSSLDSKGSIFSMITQARQLEVDGKDGTKDLFSALSKCEASGLERLMLGLNCAPCWRYLCQLGPNFGQLKELVIHMHDWQSERMNDDQIVKLSKSFPNLQVLYLDIQPSNFTCRAYKHIGDHCRKLQQLDLSPSLSAVDVYYDVLYDYCNIDLWPLWEGDGDVSGQPLFPSLIDIRPPVYITRIRDRNRFMARHFPKLSVPSQAKADQLGQLW